MDTAKIVRIVAIVVALAAAFVPDIPYVGWSLIIVIAGIALGYLAVTEERRLIFLVTAVALAQVAGAFGAIPVYGEHISSIMGHLSSIINAAALTVILVIIKDRLTE